MDELDALKILRGEKPTSAKNTIETEKTSLP